MEQSKEQDDEKRAEPGDQPGAVAPRLAAGPPAPRKDLVAEVSQVLRPDLVNLG